MGAWAGLSALAVCLAWPGDLAAQSNGEAGDAARSAALSLLAPGLGQHRQGQARKWIFVSIEVAGWALYLERRGAGGSARDAYRDFAWERGRIQVGARVDGDFDYYERLTKWTASGSFDRSELQPGVQPETDPSTFNGMIWQRAVSIFGGGQPGDPAHARALTYYHEHAYGSELLWDWSEDDGGRAELADLITTSDERFRQATTALGIVIANHFVAAVEAYLWGGGGAPARVRVASDPYSITSGWGLTVTLPLGR